MDSTRARSRKKSRTKTVDSARPSTTPPSARFGKVRPDGTRLSSAMDVNGFNIEERKTKKEFRASSPSDSEGKRAVEIFLDAAYSRRDAEDARRRPSRFSTAKKLDEPLDRKTRLYFESAPPDLLKRFVALGFSPARGASRVVDVCQTFQAAKSSTVLNLGAKASSSLGFALTFRRRFVSTNRLEQRKRFEISRQTNETIRPNDGRQHDRRFENVRSRLDLRSNAVAPRRIRSWRSLAVRLRTKRATFRFRPIGRSGFSPLARLKIGERSSRFGGSPDCANRNRCI